MPQPAGTAQGAEPATGRQRDDGLAAVVDIGSNSVRLVVYTGLVRTPLAVFNEKVLCGLGRGLEVTGHLDSAGKERALHTLHRFAGLMRQMQVDHVLPVATAAVRDARDGDAFLDQVAQATGINAQLIDGSEEGRLSALGVLSASPEAEGLMGDLGGGSLELVEVGAGGLGAGTTLPLGALRLGSENGRGRRRKQIDAALKGVDWLAQAEGRTLYVVGGAWRAIGRVHMAQTEHPLRVLHGYRVDAAEMVRFCDLLAGFGEQSLKSLSQIPKGRQETLPVAAQILRSVLRRSRCREVVFSAYGLREGLIFDKLDAAMRAEDPLIAACRVVAQLTPRFPVAGEDLLAWLDPLFPNESPSERRLRLAASLLSDVGWRVHPDYRADHAMADVMHTPVVGVDHRERVKLALAARARYSHRGNEEAALPYRALIDADDASWSRKVGLAVRLAHTVSGGVPRILEQFKLELRPQRIVLRCLDGAAEPLEDVVAARLRHLGRVFERQTLYLPAG